ncbi:hypothetical protein A9K55_007309 [Cordyceps militaris]|uniref:Uncharacterized protein n=1 Tax=Cordyceps militaris TaxID=73501 RepID=A0A2H4SHR6_CORMI|nr:hypothetical protein A9K55_007309 [Cordyceps militaris]
MSAVKTALLLAPAITSTCTLHVPGRQQPAAGVLAAAAAGLGAAGAGVPGGDGGDVGRGGACARAAAGARRGANGCWYAAAAACAAAHLAWVPWMAGPVRDMLADDGVAIEDEDGLTNVEQQLRWLRVNRARTWTTDLVGWVCALVAVTKTLAVP